MRSDRFAGTLPALDSRTPFFAGAVDLIEHRLVVGVFGFRSGQADDVDVVPGDRVSHGGTPAAADVEQRQLGLAFSLWSSASLRFAYCASSSVISTFSGAAVRHRWVKPELEELVDFVVVIELLRTGGLSCVPLVVAL